MSNRTIRINELMQREISDILRQRHQSEAVTITITEVRVAPDLRDARVFFSVVGDAETIADRARWLRRQGPAIREELSHRIVLKYLPRMEYVLDESAVTGTRVLQILDEIEHPRKTTP
ncbi:MAG TPA: 30S ribosome-binding factor RbfA [Opitutaceae bacterium]|nr:30S ribosome-binding factor RbfA [Opitutaceae bacterium]